MRLGDGRAQAGGASVSPQKLERTPRGAYCGALLVAQEGEMDSSVLIRTLEGVAEQPSIARWGAGCGITHDSDPAAEYLEMLLKATPVTGDGAPAVALRETMRVAHGEVAWLDRHLARLASGGAGPSVLARVRDEVANQLDAFGRSASYGRLGVTVTPDGEVTAGITDAALLARRRGWSGDSAGHGRQHRPTCPQGAAKPASRRYWDRAHRAAERLGADQALLVDANGTLIDGSTATVWLLHGDTLSTPPAPPAVAGVAREVVFDVASASRTRSRSSGLSRSPTSRAPTRSFSATRLVAWFVLAEVRPSVAECDVRHNRRSLVATEGAYPSRYRVV